VGLDGNLYQAMVVIHILTVVFGLGPLVLAGVFAVKAERVDRRAELAVGLVQYEVTKIAHKLVYLIFVTGVALVLMSDGAIEMGDFWVSLSMLTYIAALGISHGMLVPNERRMNVLRKELAEMDGQEFASQPEQALELADRTKRSAAMGMTLNLLTAFLVYLMVFKPGL
jgi:uncharacterized membrane protein